MSREAHRWCIVTSDDRPRSLISTYWAMHAAINELYASMHDYGFTYVQVQGCGYVQHELSTWKKRSSGWCKVPAVAHVLLHGVPSRRKGEARRRCANLLYLDSDASISNVSISIDDYLERARKRGDEALQDDRWKLLFASNYWFEPDSINSGVFFVRGDAATCGLLRFWWTGAHFPALDQRWLFGARTSDQEVMRRMYAFNRPWGARVRLLPTARFYRRDDSTWMQPGRGMAWEHAGAPEATHRFDDFIHHGIKRHPRDLAKLLSRLSHAWSIVGRRGPADCRCIPDPSTCDSNSQLTCRHYPAQVNVHPALQLNESELAAVFDVQPASLGQSSSDGSLNSCPWPQPERGTPEGFQDYRRCCAPSRRRSHLHTNLDGTLSAIPRPCWAKQRWLQREVEEWICSNQTE